MSCVFFFFFKQKTAYEMRISDWSSDVCSSDLAAGLPEDPAGPGIPGHPDACDALRHQGRHQAYVAGMARHDPDLLPAPPGEPRVDPHPLGGDRKSAV